MAYSPLKQERIKLLKDIKVIKQANAEITKTLKGLK